MTFSSPKINLDIIPARTRVSNTPQKILFVGQMIKNGGTVGSGNPAGTFDPATAGKLVNNVPDDEKGNSILYGPRSIITAMLREARLVNPVTRFDAFVLPDAAGDALDAELNFLGTSTEDGEFIVAIGSKRNHTFTLPVPKGSTGASFFGANLPNLINADLTVPIIATDIGLGVIELNGANTGNEARHITIQTIKIPLGITVEIVGFAGTTANPDLTSIFQDIARQRYQTIVWPQTYDEDTGTPADSWRPLIEDLETRFNSDNEIRDGQAIISFTQSFGDQKIQGESLDTRVISLYANAETLGPTGILPQEGSALVELDYVIASQIGAIRGLRLTEGADISQFVTSTSGALDNFGGPALASLPYFNTPFDLLPVIREDAGFENKQIRELQEVGLSMLENNDADTKIVSLDAVTLYKTNTNGKPDKSFFFLNAVDTMSNVREYFFNNLKSRYAQSRLTEGDLVSNRNQANVSSIKAFIGGLYRDLAGPEFVLTQLGERATKFFKDNLTVTLDLEAGKVIIFALIPIVTQLREIVGTLELTFSTNG